jgi:predicted Fe-Mo cluster-binding NifX family protein
MLIAIASTDGETVNEHFGRANRFLIYEVSPGKQTLIMVRDVEPLSTGDKNHPFDPERMARAAEAVKDCKLLYCSKIGDHPRQELEKFGVTSIIGTRQINSIFEE